MNDELPTTEIKVRAERRCGELLARTEKHNGGHAMKARSNDATEVPPTLAQMGLTKDESSRYQQLAACATPAANRRRMRRFRRWLRWA